MGEGQTFLTMGTQFLTWLLTSCGSILDFLTKHEVTVYFLVAGLAYIAIRVIKSFIRI